MTEHRKCRSYAVVVWCDNDEDIDGLYEYACLLHALTDHTTFGAYVDDKYDDVVEGNTCT